MLQYPLREIGIPGVQGGKKKILEVALIKTPFPRPPLKFEKHCVSQITEAEQIGAPVSSEELVGIQSGQVQLLQLICPHLLDQRGIGHLLGGRTYLSHRHTFVRRSISEQLLIFLVAAFFILLPAAATARSIAAQLWNRPADGESSANDERPPFLRKLL